MAPEFAAIRDDLLSLQIGYARWQCLKPSLEKAYRFAASGNREEKKEVWGVVEELLRELFQDRTKEILAKVKKGQVGAHTRFPSTWFSYSSALVGESRS